MSEFSTVLAVNFRKVLSNINFQGDEKTDIPFVDPGSLMEKVFELEDRNLSLIGHFQQSEEEFDEIRKLFTITANKLGSQIDQLKSHMDVINSTVQRNDIRAQGLKSIWKIYRVPKFSTKIWIFRQKRDI